SQPPHAFSAARRSRWRAKRSVRALPIKHGCSQVPSGSLPPVRHMVSAWTRPRDRSLHQVASRRIMERAGALIVFPGCLRVGGLSLSARGQITQSLATDAEAGGAGLIVKSTGRDEVPLYAPPVLVHVAEVVAADHVTAIAEPAIDPGRLRRLRAGALALVSQ